MAGRYRVVTRLGAGGMSEVFEVEHLATGRRLAMKTLRAGLGDELERRFEREARATSLLDHEGIVQVVDYGVLERGGRFLVMELVRGTSLAELVDGLALTARRGLRIVRRVLDALGHAHRVGVIHRDLKPDNVMVVGEEGDDRVKLLDFGIARLVGLARRELGADNLTSLGRTFGTPDYMSPEQALGSPTDGRSDLYSAGVILFEILAGRRPFHASTPMGVARLQVSASPPTLAWAAPGRRFSPELEELVARALRKRPEERFATAAEMIRSLDAALRSLPPDPPRREPTRPLGSRHAPAALSRIRRGTASCALPAGAGGGRRGAARASTVRLPIVAPTAGTAGCRDASGAARPDAPTGVAAWIVRRARLPRPGARAAVRVGAALVALALVADVLVARVRRELGAPANRSPAPAAGPLGGDPADGQGRGLARRAAQVLRSRGPGAAVALLEGERGRAGDRDAEAELVLGHARAALGRHVEALGAYERAVALAPASAADLLLQRNVLAILAGAEEPVALAALDLVAMRLEGDAARDALVREASRGRTPRLRERARAAAERAGLAGRVDWVEGWILDLRQGETCGARREAVRRLGAAGDPRALAPLRRLRARPSGGRFAPPRSRDACLSRDVAAALRQLRASRAGAPS